MVSPISKSNATATTIQQNIKSDLCRQRDARAYHSVPCHYFRSGREIFSRDAIDLRIWLLDKAEAGQESHDTIQRLKHDGTLSSCVGSSEASNCQRNLQIFHDICSGEDVVQAALSLGEGNHDIAKTGDQA